MKTCIKLKKDELLCMMNQLSLIFDVVRLVDPVNTSVVDIEHGVIQHVEKSACFSVWEKDKRCDNCISLLSCSEKRRLTKFEFIDDKIYQVIAIPVIMHDDEDEISMALELVNKVTDNTLFNTYGNGSLANEISKFNTLLYTDSLTGVHNRRYFDENKYMFDSIDCFPKRIGFLVADINKFKYINDTYGHAVGDIVLKNVANTLKATLHKSDVVVRIGGDEFLVIFRNCSEGVVRKKRNELKENIASLKIKGLENIRLSIDTGYKYISNFDGRKSIVKEMYETADKNMYREKNSIQ